MSHFWVLRVPGAERRVGPVTAGAEREWDWLVLCGQRLEMRQESSCTGSPESLEWSRLRTVCYHRHALALGREACTGSREGDMLMVFHLCRGEHFRGDTHSTEFSTTRVLQAGPEGAQEQLQCALPFEGVLSTGRSQMLAGS